ncbi:hypothetical protein A5482_005160 [Cyanobacterium sp. IPPAS B-1200]|uniref:hypothetical protein n=1 Tax=Cyanobacterium sp. IPPAS B-1200 TaxID=1562720 RepID=UPI00085279A5|nr:hypothetical protein [Cyanobacterium sp. IPPAS B-1200]OEJ78690.1 hypothetical protein A5482_02100 [Cyanobacterium sp. IPPAS B-1200]
MNKIIIRQTTKNSFCFLLGVCLILLPSQKSFAARLDVKSITTGPLIDNPNTTVNDITYLNQSLPIVSVNDGTDDWRVGVNTFGAELRVRRSGVTTGTNRGIPGASITWSERLVGDPDTTVRGSLPTSTEATLGGNNLFEGTDNTFSNNANTNATDIERLDFIVEAGIAALSSRAVIVAERGSNNVHDGFKIAAITSLGQGIDSPLTWTFGTLVSVGGSTWGKTELRTSSQTPAGASDNPYTVLNNQGTANFTDTATPDNQNFGAVLITLDELVSPNTTIFGYSLFGFDVKANTSGNAVADWKNDSFYPTNTESSGQNLNGGIDLVALNAGIARNNTTEKEIPENTSVLPIIAIGLLGLKGKSLLKDRK